MSIIKQPLLYVGSKGEKRLCTLFGSAVILSQIDPDCINDLALPIKLGRTRRVATAAEGHYIEIKHRVTLDFTLTTYCSLMNSWSCRA